MNKRHEHTFLKNKTIMTNNMTRCPTSLIIRNMQLRPQLVTTLLFLLFCIFNFNQVQLF